jgi:hypothetical protein
VVIRSGGSCRRGRFGLCRQKRTSGCRARWAGSGRALSSNAAGRLEKAIGKLEERYFGGVSPDAGTLGRWNAAATEVVRVHLTDPRRKWQQLQRADEILGEVGAEAFAYLSDTSPLGFDQRLAGFGQRLMDTLRNLQPQSVEHLMKARQAVLEHDRASSERRRLERVDMAARLVRWLADAESRPTHPQSFAETVAYQLSQGSFVDWARLTLRAGDPVRELSEAYATLFEHVTAVREAQAHRFAQLLQEWTAAGLVARSQDGQTCGRLGE